MVTLSRGLALVALVTLVTVGLALTAGSAAARPAEDLNRTSGGSSDDSANSVAQASDGGNGVAQSVRFIQNAGQTENDIRFTTRGSEYAVGFEQDELIFSAVPNDKGSTPVFVRARFVNSTGSTVEGLDKLPSVANFYQGDDPDEWYSGVPTYNAIAYRDLYPGVDLFYTGNGGRLKSEYRVAPGSDPSSIRMNYTRVEDVRVRDDGSLVVKTGEGELVHEPPVAYQFVDGERTTVDARYTVDGQEVGFELGSYDEKRPLVIDPVLGYSTFLGGMEVEGDTISMVVDRSGNMYVAGDTLSTDFPTSNAAQPKNGTLSDVFVTKFNATGGVVYSTYLGGSSGPGFPGGEFRAPRGRGLAVDSGGKASVVGLTGSDDFPTRNAFQPNHAADEFGDSDIDAFVTKFNATGSIVFSTYLGGDKEEATASAPRLSVAVDPAGRTYVTGLTFSVDDPETPDDEGFPTKNAFQSSPKEEDTVGVRNAFVTKFAPDGRVTYSTYLSGAGRDRATDIAVDDEENAHVVGTTESAENSSFDVEDGRFPTKNAFQDKNAGGVASTDAFVTKLDEDGDLDYSTYLGGTPLRKPGFRDLG